MFGGNSFENLASDFNEIYWKTGATWQYITEYIVKVLYSLVKGCSFFSFVSEKMRRRPCFESQQASFFVIFFTAKAKSSCRPEEPSPEFSFASQKFLVKFWSSGPSFSAASNVERFITKDLIGTDSWIKFSKKRVKNKVFFLIDVLILFFRIARCV